MLIAVSGRQGTGKTTIARELARVLAAVYLRIDGIEQSMRGEGWPVEGEGYGVAQVVAEDNLRLGRTVVADSINPSPATRAEWRAVAARADVPMLDVELICSDQVEHRRRVETSRDVVGPKRASWQDAADLDYRAWDEHRLVVDTALLTIEQCVCEILTNAASRDRSVS
jgi:predicted kinase